MPTIPNTEEVNRITAGAKFVGDIATQNDIRIDGILEGRLYSDAHVVVGEKGVIKGEIFSKSADIYGTMTEGNIYVKDVLSLKPGCSVKGNMYFQRVQVELDAKLVGQCQILNEQEFNKVSAPVSAFLK